MSEITLLYTHNTGIGYGRLGVLLAENLADIGVKVYDDLGEPPPDKTDATEARERVGRDCAPTPTNVVSWVSVPSHARWWYDGQFSSCFTMWEASILPPSFRDTLHEFDLIVVPSTHNVELFSQYHHNVVLDPLGVDPQRWHYVPRQEPDRYFNFLVGGSGKRKGVDVAFRAFMHVFRGWKRSWGPEPQLLMKNPKGESRYRGWHRVQMISGRLTDEAEVDLYTTAHCYLQPSRGEGFGLQPLQAMAQGIPTILTDAHGHSSFARYGIPIGWSWTPAEYFIYGFAGDWWEPDFDALCERMWDVYKSWEPHRRHAERIATTVIPAEFTWRRCAERFVAAHGDALDLPYRGNGEHHRPEQLRFLVRVTRQWEADIAGFRFMWFPGKDYYEPADVKRILFERGVLDPSCLEGPDVGLADNQIERIGAYSANREWCPSCGQRLNTGPTLADHLVEAVG